MDQEAQVLVRRLRLAAFSRKLIDRATPLIRAANLRPHPYPSTARTTAIPRLSLKQSSQPPSLRQFSPNKEWALSLFKKNRTGHNIVGLALWPGRDFGRRATVPYYRWYLQQNATS
ncbi:hypothetical protein NW767_002610 [Fusarium falciforme]|nr:hypothetical protein NW767_002610 [Fusarium falciforme]